MIYQLLIFLLVAGRGAEPDGGPPRHVAGQPRHVQARLRDG